MKAALIVPGRPVPKARMTRRSKWTKRAKRSLDYQEQVAAEVMVLKAEMSGKKQLEGPLKLTVEFYFADRRHGDLSNYIKAIEDGLQYGQLFQNDKQIIRYGEGTGIYYDDNERAQVLIEEIEEGAA